MKLSDLKANPNNPRTINDKQLKMLKKALTEFGDLSGIVYNIRTDTLIGGHQRIKVLPLDTEIIIEMKYHSPTRTGTVADGYALIGGERFKYRAVDWDETRERAANLAANKHGGEFDMLKVNEWLSDFSDLDFDLELTGFPPISFEQEISTEVEEKEYKEKTMIKCPSCEYEFTK
jgi:hypothetical protein